MTEAAMDPDTARVWGLLGPRRGRRNAIVQRDLAALARISVRVLQRILKSLTEVHGKPIVTACDKRKDPDTGEPLPMGVFVPETDEEINEYMAQLGARIASCRARQQALRDFQSRGFPKAMQPDLFA